MSEIYLIDHYANNKDSFFHRRTVFSKTVLLLLILIVAIFSESFQVLFFLILNTLFILLISNIPIKMIIKWMVYPMIFASFFSISQINQGWISLIVFLRASTITFAVISFFCITPYPLIFSKISKISPFLSAVFFLTYRYFFLIIDSIENQFKLMKLRGGTSGGFKKTFFSIGNLIGTIFISFFERGEKFYNLLKLRGYDGKIYSKNKEIFSFGDILVIGWGFLILFSSHFLL